MPDPADELTILNIKQQRTYFRGMQVSPFIGNLLENTIFVKNIPPQKMSVVEAFGDIASIIAQMAPEKVVHLKAPAQLSEEVERLVKLKKNGKISPEQTSELERYLALDLFISLAKAQARTFIAQ